MRVAVSLRVVLCSAGGGEDRTRRVLRLMCVVRLLRAHLDSRGRQCRLRGCPGSRIFGMDGAAFGGFLVAFGGLPGGRPSVSGESLETPGGPFYVCEQTARFPLLGCPRVRSGRRAVQAEHVTVPSVFEHVWQSAMPPLSVLLQG